MTDSAPVAFAKSAGAGFSEWDGAFLVDAHWLINNRKSEFCRKTMHARNIISKENYVIFDLEYVSEVDLSSRRMH
jgi:hypothetical protein